MGVAKAERDFYFAKLKEIDVMLENCKDTSKVEDLKKNIKNILYEMPEELSIIDFITTRQEQVPAPNPIEIESKVDVVNIQFEEEEQGEKGTMIVETQS